MTVRKPFSIILVAWLLLAPLAAAELPQASPAEVHLSAERLARLDGLFEEYVADGRIAGAVALVTRHGKVAYSKSFGMADREAGRKMEPDNIFRIASMTKAITSIAVLILLEESKLLLSDPISKYIPEFAAPKVVVPLPEGEEKDGLPYELVPAKREITIRDLLTHTSGITYGFYGSQPFTSLYRGAGVVDGVAETEGTIGERMAKLGALPLAHHPGESYTYGLSIDVLGRLVEVVSGQSFDVFLRERLFEPLGMDDTYFFLPPEKVERLAALYVPDEAGRAVPAGPDPVTMGALVFSSTYPHGKPGTYFSGGAGLSCTAEDYARFLLMILGEGAYGDGKRLLSRKTVELLSRNHTGDLEIQAGYGFGLGFAVHLDPGVSGGMSSPGTLTWGGIFNTTFWVDPEEEIVAVMMTQIYPYGHLQLGEKFELLVYQAIDD
jgi:CubicO group peptidase (beta-lactamase class C family)